MDIPYKWYVEERDGGFLVQVGFWVPDTTTGEMGWQKGGKQYVSRYSVKSEIVGKAWDMFQKFWMHEMREMFFYNGVDIYNPHVDSDKLHGFMKKKPFQSRN